ncbi:MAG: DUF861 domain-containing protein [Gammaproteobacteria bacterium]|nr:DUF861 domain-containing protein [Gammaproteobacteria bacterium]
MNREIVSFDEPLDAELTSPPPERIVSGDPRQRIQNYFSDVQGRFHCGRWTCQVGAWRVRYTEIELCHLLSGRVRLRSDTGIEWHFGAGSTFLINKGFSGIWDTVESCEKIYAILE